ncbi:hypothetical protein ABIF68_011089 [Bradyrhizobium japonicum]
MNFTPAMTFGNWFVLFNRRQVFDAASMSLNTISFAVCCDSDPLVRTVRWRTVAKTQSWPRLFGQRPAGFKWIPAGLC